MTQRRSAVVVGVLVALSLFVPVAVWAHAALIRSAPAAKSRLDKVPTELRLWFSEAPEIRLTTVTLADSAGQLVKLGAVGQGETKLSLVVPIQAAPSPGKYTVHWSTAAADGHPSSGSYSFTILPAASLPSASLDSQTLVVHPP